MTDEQKRAGAAAWMQAMTDPDMSPADKAAHVHAAMLAAAPKGAEAQPVTAAYGAVWRNGALVMCDQFDREPCPHQPERRCKACPAAPATPAPAAPQAERPSRADLMAALKFYASGDHFNLADESAWDTVSGEPQNWWCDEAGTATIEDGSIAKMTLKGELTAAQIEDMEEGEECGAAPAVMLNGLTEAETAQTASVAGLTAAPPAQSAAAGDLAALVNVYGAAMEDKGRTGHATAEAYAAWARSNLMDALAARTQAPAVAPPEPLTDAQAQALWVGATINRTDLFGTYLRGLRDGEAAHGIRLDDGGGV